MMIIERDSASTSSNSSVFERNVALCNLQGDGGCSVGDLQGDLQINYVVQGIFLYLFVVLFCLCIIIFIASKATCVALVIFLYLSSVHFYFAYAWN